MSLERCVGSVDRRTMNNVWIRVRRRLDQGQDEERLRECREVGRDLANQSCQRQTLSG